MRHSLSISKITPMLATLIEDPFDRKGWLFEVKWDGYRAIASKNKEVQLFSRKHQSFNDSFPSIVTCLKKIPGKFIVDGEIVILDEKGRANFQRLQNYQREKDIPYYFVFDILSYNGKDLTREPLIERKTILKKLLKGSPSQIRFSDHVEEKGKAFFRAALKSGLEGIMAKKSDSTYQFRRSTDWLKIKTKLRQEVVIGGFTAPRASRKYFGALLVGVYEKGKLNYVGHVGGGFDEKQLEEIHQQLLKIVTSTCPFLKEPQPNEPATWVKPKLVCDVSFSEWTNDGIMRQPIFKGMRTDKPPKDVVQEKPIRKAT